MAVLSRRYCGFYDDCGGHSDWDSWGRWVAFAVIVFCAFILFLGFSCLNARRRRRHGLRPITGTGWMAPPPGPPPPHQPVYYGNQNDYYGSPPPPQYSANPQNYGYFGAQNPGQQQNGIELQQPAAAHAASRAYSPPPGPPPSKV
ncbi:hypothetical protein POX_d05793 [Penicillium oxalicum]|uniref:Chitin synthesis regulation, Congo red resistance, RCR protein n=1 Tax=Penicillium oxalicum (strain 114-2 / CGMCC 5302) TaxID=933388 RepID=S8BB03_PENO1|nr:hypothetical protein POX_d05793 [Penicillium oxalicum]EPS32032.1 hypothetical protein PDE_06991 [Penicillium oxalicum 114-2]KAI2790284.1 hypothetical protein POX_d05793 [Penicillium oxalicum]